MALEDETSSMEIEDSNKMPDQVEMSTVSKKVNVKSGGKLLAVVREQYIRNDLSCRSMLCSKQLCNIKELENSNNGLLPSNVTHYIIPFVDVAGHYMEVLESPEITGIIFLQTVVNAIKLGKEGQYRRLCSIVRDNRKSSIFFANEFFEPTVTVRNKETLSVWRSNAVYQSGIWFYEHLGDNFYILFYYTIIRASTTLSLMIFECPSFCFSSIEHFLFQEVKSQL